MCCSCLCSCVSSPFLSRCFVLLWARFSYTQNPSESLEKSISNDLELGNFQFVASEVSHSRSHVSSAHIQVSTNRGCISAFTLILFWCWLIALCEWYLAHIIAVWIYSHPSLFRRQFSDTKKNRKQCNDRSKRQTHPWVRRHGLRTTQESRRSRCRC